jgi:hypothetical protein
MKKFDWVLLVILVTGGIARYWGINFGLPHTDCRPDESIIVLHALGFFSGDFNPHYFHYPTFYMYIIWFFYVLYFISGKMLGRYSSTSDLLQESIINPNNFYLIDRITSAFLGTITIFIVYQIIKEIIDRKTAIVSSLFLSLAYLHVRDSHFGVTDVPMTFGVMVSILMILKSFKEKTAKSYAICGILAGLTASTKYNGILLVIPMCIVHFINTIDEKYKNRLDSDEIDELRATQLPKLTQYGIAAKRFLLDFLDKRILLFAVTVISAFLLTTPFALLDFKSFQKDFLFEVNHLNTGHGLNLGIGWWYHLRFTLPLGLGWSLFVASFAGSMILFKSHTRKAVILFSFPLIYYLVLGKGYTVFLRYMMPTIPFACIAAAVLVISFSKRVVRDFEMRSLENHIILFLATLMIFQSAYNIAQADRLLATRDNRLIAAEWVYKNVQKNSSIYQTDRSYGTLQLDRSLEGNVKDYQPKDYKQWDYDEKSQKFTFNNEERNGFPEYILKQEYPLVQYSKVSSKIEEILKNHYYIKKKLEVINMYNKENWFDQIDAFYMPFSGFREIQRPGPNIYIYGKK